MYVTRPNVDICGAEHIRHLNEMQWRTWNGEWIEAVFGIQRNNCDCALVDAELELMEMTMERHGGHERAKRCRLPHASAWHEWVSHFRTNCTAHVCASECDTHELIVGMSCTSRLHLGRPLFPFLCSPIQSLLFHFTHVCFTHFVLFFCRRSVCELLRNDWRIWKGGNANTHTHAHRKKNESRSWMWCMFGNDMQMRTQFVFICDCCLFTKSKRDVRMRLFYSEMERKRKAKFEIRKWTAPDVCSVPCLIHPHYYYDWRLWQMHKCAYGASHSPSTAHTPHPSPIHANDLRNR